MTLYVGTDEAGYGPNLGPLLIAATAWRWDAQAGEDDLYVPLGASVTREVDRQRIAIADSKQLYKSGAGLASLERGVYASLAQTMALPLRWRELWQRLLPSCRSELESVPWYAAYDSALPVACPLDELTRAADFLADDLRRQTIQLLPLRVAAVFPARFNDLVDQLGSKGAALSHVTLDLVQQVVADCDEPSIVVQCDKHGGRNRYAPLLQVRFPDYLVEVVRESRASSVYRWGPARRRIEFRFVARGEHFLPAALASMLAKYLRELAMLAFNAFWQQHLPDLRPTAGYPTDARRFQRQIHALQRQLGIADRLLWRQR
jgi:hypothetical protein